nr:MAG TPA: hypothetical protein [Caudoviricetes sp.]
MRNPHFLDSHFWKGLWKPWKPVKIASVQSVCRAA